MSKRKFEMGEEIVVTEKVSAYNRNRGVIPGMRGKISYQYQGYYRASMENGLIIEDSSTAFTKESKSSIDEFTEQIEKAEAKIEATKNFITETKSKIAFMKEVGSDIFDENEFKAYHTLTIIEQSGMSKIEKAKAIALLIAGK